MREDVEQGLEARLHSLAIHLLRGVRDQDRVTGLSPARLSALSVLVFAGPQRLGELADKEQVRAPTMSRIVGGLVDEGLAARKPDPTDGRVVRIVATAAGRRVLARARRLRLERLQRLLSGLTGEERRVVERATEILARRLRQG